MTWKQYHRLEDIHGFLDYLATTYPAKISVRSIGKSFEGRDLKVCYFTFFNTFIYIIANRFLSKAILIFLRYCVSQTANQQIEQSS